MSTSQGPTRKMLELGINVVVSHFYLQVHCQILLPLSELWEVPLPDDSSFLEIILPEEDQSFQLVSLEEQNFYALNFGQEKV